MHCPMCNNNLEGELMYDTFFKQHHNEQKALEYAAMYGATKTEGRWGRQLGTYDLTKDETIGYCCPDCGHKWQREI